MGQGDRPFHQGEEAGVPFPAGAWLVPCGWMEDNTVRTFAGDAHAPLTDKERCALIALFEMRWWDVESELTP